MKGVSVIVASAIVIVISITAAFLALQYGTPAIDRTKEIMLLQEGKNNLISIDNAIKSVAEEGEGSTRNFRIVSSGGFYDIEDEDEEIIFLMDTFSQIVGVGVSKMENGINVTGESGHIRLVLNLDNFNITGRGEFGKGSYNLIVRNEGYDAINQKQMVSISI